MKKEIKIGKKKVTFEANAATPIKYNYTFGRDLQQELILADEGNELPDTGFNLAYVMAGAEGEIVDWLGQFDIGEFNEALVDIIGLYMESLQTTNKAKSKNPTKAES